MGLLTPFYFLYETTLHACFKVFEYMLSLYIHFFKEIIKITLNILKIYY